MLQRRKASESLAPNRFSQRGRRRLYTEQDLSGSSENDCVSNGDELKPSPAISPSLTEVNRERPTLKIPASVPKKDLNAATCLSIPTKLSDPKNPLEANTAGMQYFKVKEPTAEESTDHLDGDLSLPVREYSCEICGKAFPKISKLNRHVDGVHKNLRNFQCNTCGHSFKERGTLRTHVDTVHKNLRNSPCDICGHSFRKNGDLNRHINMVHKNLRNFPCDICDRSFQQKTGLNRHISAVHRKLVAYVCATCGRAFTINSSLKRHLRHLHPEQKQENPS